MCVCVCMRVCVCVCKSVSGLCKSGRLGGYDRRRYMSYEEEDTCHMRRRIHVI